MDRDPECIFCKIVAVEIPASVVYETEAVIAFLDVNPLAEGHLLIVPREHYTSVTEIPADVCNRLFSPVPKLGAALLEVTGAGGFNVLLNSGTIAGQVIPHVHCHLIPRKPGDELGYRWNVGEYAPGRDAEMAAVLQASLARRR